MKITLCYSMQMAEKAEEVKKKLEDKGHKTSVSIFNYEYLGKNDDDKEKLKLDQKYNLNAMAKDFKRIEDSDAILVLNYEKNGISNYIGGNVFLEMGVAYYLNKPIYLLNPIPNISYESEIIGMKPIIINRDLTKIKKTAN